MAAGEMAWRDIDAAIGLLLFAAFLVWGGVAHGWRALAAFAWETLTIVVPLGLIGVVLALAQGWWG